MSFVLMIFLYSSAGVDVRTQEFTSRENCEAAREHALAHVPKAGPRGREVAVCMPK